MRRERIWTPGARRVKNMDAFHPSQHALPRGLQPIGDLPLLQQRRSITSGWVSGAVAIELFILAFLSKALPSLGTQLFPEFFPCLAGDIFLFYSVGLDSRWLPLFATFRSLHSDPCRKPR